MQWIRKFVILLALFFTLQGFGFSQKNNVFSLQLLEYIKSNAELPLDAQSEGSFSFNSIHVPDISITIDETNYAYDGQPPSLDLRDAYITPKVYFEKAIHDAHPRQPKISLMFGRGQVQKNISATLCTGDQRCSLSSFTLTYHLRTHYISVKSNHTGLLKYDFEAEIEKKLTSQEEKALNCILRTELYNEDSYLWSYHGIQKYDSEAPEDPDINGVSGATTLQKGNLECEIPEGALWTALTVFAHAYEFKNQVQSKSVDQWMSFVDQNTQAQLLEDWEMQ